MEADSKAAIEKMTHATFDRNYIDQISFLRCCATRAYSNTQSGLVNGARGKKALAGATQRECRICEMFASLSFCLYLLRFLGIVKSNINCIIVKIVHLQLETCSSHFFGGGEWLFEITHKLPRVAPTWHKVQRGALFGVANLI